MVHRLPLLYHAKSKFMLRDHVSDNKEGPVRFLAEKIRGMTKAIFRADSYARLTLPNNVIDTLEADDEGNIWFFTSCNDNHTKYSEKEFYAYLEYYQKGCDERLLISGLAYIQDAGSIPDRFKERCKDINNTTFMIRLKVMKAEYQYVPKKSDTWKERAKNAFRNLFVPGQHSRQYDFS
jgi:hypothetical protein